MNLRLLAVALGALAGVLTMPKTTAPPAVGGDWRQRPVGRHFRLGEFVTWSTGRGPHREPPAAVQAEIRRLVAGVLDPLREALGRPVAIASGWRPRDLFPLAGGKTSAHTLGAGADVYVAGIAPAQLARVADDLARRGVIAQGGVGVYPPGYPKDDGTTRDTWDPTVHLDTGAHTTPGRRRWPLAWWRASVA